jgi:hypothetical protein
MPLLSADQQNLIRDYVFLPLIFYIFDRDKKVLLTSSLKTKSPYVHLLEKASGKVELDLIQTKRTLRSLGIKIYQESRTKQGASLNYCFAGYHYFAHYHWEYTKAEVEAYMNRYLTVHDD